MRLSWIFLSHIALVEAILGSHRAFFPWHAALMRWCEDNLVSIETVLDSRGVCLALQEAVIGSHRALFILMETFF